jgi:hypothetical protein
MFIKYQINSATIIAAIHRKNSFISLFFVFISFISTTSRKLRRCKCYNLNATLNVLINSIFEWKKKLRRKRNEKLDAIRRRFLP